MTPEKYPALTDDERRLLQALADNGPSRDLPRPVRGWFELYGMVAETPQGWVITRTGREALERFPTAEDRVTPQGVRRVVRSPHTGKRLPLRRKSPFES